MNSISRPLLAVITFALGSIAGWFGHKAGKPSPISVGDTMITLSKTTDVHAARAEISSPAGKPATASLKVLGEQLLKDASLSNGPNLLYLDFVTQSASLTEGELVVMLDQFLKEGAVFEAEDGSNDGIPAVLGCLLQRLATANPRAAADWLVRDELDLVDDTIRDQAWRAIASRDPALMETIISKTTESDPKHHLNAIRLEGLAATDPQKALTVLKQLVEKDSDAADVYSQIIPGIVTKLAQHQPLLAAQMSLEFSMNDEKSLNPLEAVMGVWAKSDAKASLAWALGLQGNEAVKACQARVAVREDDDEIATVASSMKQWKGVEVPDAELESGHPNELKRLLWNVETHLMDEGGVDAVRAWVDSLEDDVLKAAALDRLTDKWVQEDAVAASAYIASLPDSADKNRGIESLIQAIVSSDPERAFAWAGKMTDETKKSDLMKSAMKTWLEAEPLAAARMLEQMPPQFRESIGSKKNANEDSFAPGGTGPRRVRLQIPRETGNTGQSPP